MPPQNTLVSFYSPSIAAQTERVLYTIDRLGHVIRRSMLPQSMLLTPHPPPILSTPMRVGFTEGSQLLPRARPVSKAPAAEKKVFCFSLLPPVTPGGEKVWGGVLTPGQKTINGTTAMALSPRGKIPRPTQVAHGRTARWDGKDLALRSGKARETEVCKCAHVRLDRGRSGVSSVMTSVWTSYENQTLKLHAIDCRWVEYAAALVRS
jgi:hypothetical protein